MKKVQKNTVQAYVSPYLRQPVRRLEEVAVEDRAATQPSSETSDQRTPAAQLSALKRSA